MPEEKIVKIADKRITQVYECMCGSQIFYLRIDGRCECSECNSLTRGIFVTDQPPWGDDD